jgi:tetratricopeptide (TPR) repeat protein
MSLLTVLAVPVLAFGSSSYGLQGRIEPPAALPVFLYGANTPFENSTKCDKDGRFRFAKVPAGTYTLIVATPARGDLVQTVEVSAGTADSRGRVDLVLRIDASRLEHDGARTGATISARLLSIPGNASKEYAEAQHCLSRGDSDCAATHLRRSVEIAPGFSAGWNHLGTLAYQKGRFDEAEGDFRRALDADPDAFDPLVNLGGVLLNLARPRDAFEYNQRAVERRPNDALANSQLGRNYYELGDPETAERFLKITVSLDPAHFSFPQLTLARIYQWRGDKPAAISTLQDFLARHPDAPQAAAVRLKITELER